MRRSRAAGRSASSPDRFARPWRRQVGGNHASPAALDRFSRHVRGGRRRARCGRKTLRARGHGERRRAPDRDAADRSVKDRGADRRARRRRICARPPPPPRRQGSSTPRRSSQPPPSPPRRKTRRAGSLYAFVAIKADDAKANGRYDLVTQGATAAYAAYQHAAAPDAQALALAMLGDLLARHEAWRRRARRLKASPRSPRQHRRAQDLRGHAREARLPHPRLQGRQRIRARRASASTSPISSRARPTSRPMSPCPALRTRRSRAEDQQICVEGLKHGERYAIVLRQGLPSAVGESLLKSADYEIYVRDRSPQAHFAGKAYVLPRQGQQGAPLVTVNTAKVAVDVYRIGDRNLIATVSRDDFLKPIDSSRAEDIENTDGVKVWSGSMDVASELNKDVVTEFPVLKAVGHAEARRLSRHRAPVEGEGRRIRSRRRRRAARDAMDGRLRPRPDRDVRRRRHARARPVARLRRAARRRRAQARRAQQRSAGDQDDRRRTAGSISTPACRAARAARRPGCSSRRSATTTISSTSRRTPSTSPTAASAAATRPPGSTPSSTPSAASTARARRCSRPRCLRDAKGVAKPGLPLTLVVKRPDGVEYKRATVADQGLGGRAFAVPLLAGSAPGKVDDRRLRRPEGRPDRRDPSSCSRTIFPSGSISRCIPPNPSSIRASRSSSRSTRASSTARRRAGSTSPARSAFRRSRTPRSPAFPAMSRASPTTSSPPSRTSSPTRSQTDAKGHADLSVDLPEATATRPLEAKLIVDVAEPGGRTVERTATLPVRAKGVMIGVKKDFDDSLERRRRRDLRGDRRRARRRARRAQGGRMVALPGRPTTTNGSTPTAAGATSRSSRRSGSPSGTIDIGADAPAKFAAPVGWGAHRLEVKTLDGEETSFTFDVGWSGTASADTPDNVVVTLDKTNYAPGDEAKLRIASRFAGKATVALVGDSRRALHRRRPRRRRQRRAVQGRRRLGPGRLCGRADPSAARRAGASACPAARSASPGSASPETRASSTSRSTRRAREARASR